MMPKSSKFMQFNFQNHHFEFVRLADAEDAENEYVHTEPESEFETQTSNICIENMKIGTHFQNCASKAHRNVSLHVQVGE